MASRRAMGELEGEVLTLLWAADAALTPADVRERLGGGIAYTTAMTILTRLWQKGLVAREPCGRAFAYHPLVTEAELAAQRMRATLDRTNDRHAALASFVGTLSKKDERALRRVLGQLETKG